VVCRGENSMGCWEECVFHRFLGGKICRCVLSLFDLQYSLTLKFLCWHLFFFFWIIIERPGTEVTLCHRIRPVCPFMFSSAWFMKLGAPVFSAHKCIILYLLNEFFPLLMYSNLLYCSWLILAWYGLSDEYSYSCLPANSFCLEFHFLSFYWVWGHLCQWSGLLVDSFLVDSMILFFNPSSQSAFFFFSVLEFELRPD
jgi:hypothetical protein